MAGCVHGVGIGKQLYSYKSVLGVALLIFIATCASMPTLDAQSDQPFLSLDCGGAQHNYTDSHGLLWVTDDDYIDTGKRFQQPYSGDPAGDMRALESFRYFPGDRNKYCYDLQTPSSIYLVRASFYMNQSEFTRRQPFVFIFSVDATDWFTVRSGDQQSSLLVVQEGIFYPPNYSTYFCLRPVSGEPFISSLELRELADPDSQSQDVYFYQGCYSQFLALGVRYNAGAQNVPNVRSPADKFDRIWTTPDASMGENFTFSHNFTQPSNTTVDQYYVPTTVMQDAWLFSPSDQNNWITFNPVFADGPQVYLTPTEYAFVVVYSQILNTSVSGPVLIDIYLGDSDTNSLNSSTEPNLASTPFVTLTGNDITIELLSDFGDVPPSMNAVEVYSQHSYNASKTYFSDALVIEVLKTMFSLTDWQGDPCVPVPYNWLSCDLHDATFGRGQCSNCSESRSIFATFFNVTSLSLSNVPNANYSSISGVILAERLRGLNAMSITSSGVDNPSFMFLINHTSLGLTTLDLSYNAIEALPLASDWAGMDNDAFKNLTTLDLSHNELTGLLSSFEGVPFSTALQNLDLSYNGFKNFPEKWNNTTITSLVTLDLSHNQFDGDISSLDKWVQANSGSLQELNISHNKLGGVFSSDLYFSLPQLTTANFDLNAIEGVLNLSTWYAAWNEAALEEAGRPRGRRPASNDSSKSAVTQQLFSFMNNSIVDIVPSAKGFDRATHALFSKYRAYGIMLNGNPYCHHVKSSVQRHLCRSSTSVGFEEDGKDKNQKVLILSLCGGIVALLLFSVTSATLWKLWKQLYALRDIQQALAERKVQPPFYRYNDLKNATKDFHNDSKLGHGGFGVVYKGDLLDETLAVKKLFNSQKVQVIDEFLNEVVLITGIKHRNLVQLKGCCIKDKERILVYEYAERGNLAEALWGSQAHGGLNWKQRLNICVGVARGLSYLHEELQPSIIHRDIKPQNILLDNNFSPKIADFGLARHVTDEVNQAHYTQIAGTLGYFAPEYAMQGQVSDKTDVYSYGVLILEVVSGRKCIDSTLPIQEKFLKDWVYSMRKKSVLFDILQPELRDHCNVAEVSRVINIALLCVQHHPDRRPTMSQVVTMFSGSKDIDFFSDEFENMHSTFEDLMASVSHDEGYSALHPVEEESLVSPLIDLGSQSVFTVNSGSRSSSGPNIELSTVCGR